MLTTRGSLRRQAWLVAGLCMVADGTDALLNGGSTVQHGLLIAGTVLVDATLAGPARLSGAVALLHAVFWLIATVLSGESPGNDGGMLIAGYRAGAWLRGVPAVASLAVLAGSTLTVGLLHGFSLLVIAVGTAKIALLPWLVGRYTTARRAYLATMEQQAERERRAAHEAVEKAIAEERGAIARDLHDVIVHHVSAIGMHAGAARLGLGSADSSDSTKLEGSLRAVETSSRAAMVDLRHLLDILHGNRHEGARQPGLENLDELFDGVRAAGMPARLHVSGTPREVPESLDITIYRIVQEMLTNALRHGDPSGVDVSLTYGSREFVVVAENVVSAPGETGATPGRGLAGIRHRASMFSGRITYGPQPDGRTWRTTATFPLEER
jgi:signal transduction histidine kinase